MQVSSIYKNKNLSNSPTHKSKSDEEKGDEKEASKHNKRIYEFKRHGKEMERHI